MGPKFTNGDLVKWTNSKGVQGSGMVIETNVWAKNGQAPHVLVAVDADPGDEHRVIYCAETWLTLVKAGA